MLCTRPDRPQGPPSLLYNVYRVSFPGINFPGRGVYHPHHLAPRLKKEQSYTSTPSLGHHGLFQGDLYLYLLLFDFDSPGLDTRDQLYLLKVAALSLRVFKIHFLYCNCKPPCLLGTQLLLLFKIRRSILIKHWDLKFICCCNTTSLNFCTYQTSGQIQRTRMCAVSRYTLYIERTSTINCPEVEQQYSTLLHTNSTQKNTINWARPALFPN